VLICRDDHPGRGVNGCHGVNWSRIPLIFAGRVSGTGPCWISHWLPTIRGFGLTTRCNAASTALGLVAEGVGAAVVPSLAVQKDAYPRIRVVALIEPVVSRSLVLISPKNAHLSPAAQALYAVLTRHARSSGAGSRRSGRR